MECRYCLENRDFIEAEFCKDELINKLIERRSILSLVSTKLWYQFNIS